MNVTSTALESEKKTDKLCRLGAIMKATLTGSNSVAETASSIFPLVKAFSPRNRLHLKSLKSEGQLRNEYQFKVILTQNHYA